MIDTKCFCISLKEADDDRVLANKEFKKVGLDVEYYLAERSPLGGMHGCFTSHIEVLKKGLETNQKYIMIMEDDIYFDIYDHHIFKKINLFINSLPDTNWCFSFGYLTSKYSKKINSDFNMLKACQCTHAYLVPRHTAEKLITLKWEGIAIDYHWLKKIDQFYVPNSMIAFQRDHISSISPAFTSRLFNIVGFRNVSHLSELWSSSAEYILILLLIILFFLLLMIYDSYHILYKI